MISNQNVKAKYSGNGLTRVFPITFAYTDKTQVKVLTATDGAETIVDANDYTVTSAGVTYPKDMEQPAVPIGTYIVVYRETPQTQETDFTNQGGAWPESIEKALDKVTQEIQEIKEVVERCVRVNKGDEITPKELIDSIKQSTADAAANANAAEQSALSADADAQQCATDAATVASSIDRVERIEADLEAASKYLGARATVYDPAKSYTPADVVMMPTGTVYRCLIASRGEDPATSYKWQQASCTINDAFELDINMDIMPRSHPKTATHWEVDANEDIMPYQPIPFILIR